MFAEAEYPTQHHRARNITIVAGALLVLVLAVVTLAARGAATEAAPGSSTPAVSAAGKSGAGAPRANDPPPTSTPHGWQWESYHVSLFQPLDYNVALPVHAVYGPAELDGAQRAGWDHSALGALGAGAQLIDRTSYDRTQAETHIADGPQKAAVVGAVPQQAVPREPRPGWQPTLVGFNFVSYDAASAVIEYIHTAGPSYGWSSCTTALRWSGGDWRLVAPPDGVGPCQAAHTFDSAPPNYIRWGPTS